MGKLIKTVLGGLCAITVFVGSGCDNGLTFLVRDSSSGGEIAESSFVESLSSECGTTEQETDIFVGNYAEVSRSEMEAFCKKIEKITLEEVIRTTAGLKFYAWHDGIGIYVEEEEAETETVEMTADIRLLPLNEDGKFHLQLLTVQTENENTLTTSIYLEDTNLYKQTTLGGETTKEHKEFSLEKYLREIENDGGFGMVAGLIGGNPLTYVSHQWSISEFMPAGASVTYCLDETDSAYNKIKIELEANNVEWYKEIKATFIGVYTKDNRYVASQLYMKEDRNEEGESVRQEAKASVTPWEGTIAPPDDLDSYLPANS